VSGMQEQTGWLDKLTLDDGHDGALLDGRGALETVGVDTTEELSLEVHGIEGIGGLIVVGLDLSCSAGNLVSAVRGAECTRGGESFDRRRRRRSRRLVVQDERAFGRQQRRTRWTYPRGPLQDRKP
jgi:hypothetical protein